MRSCARLRGRCSRSPCRRRCRPASTPLPRRSMRMVTAGGPQRSSQRTRGDHGGGPGAGAGAAGQRQAHRSGRWGADTVRFGDPARAGTQVAAGAEVLPLLYLHGLSSNDFGPALTQFLGTSHGLSAATITRLTAQWQDEAIAFNKRSLAETDYVYVWVDGIHLKVRLEQDKVCLLVMIGVRADGTKELVALADGFRESSQSWADLLRSCRRRGMTAPVLAVGDGALGFWKALREVFPNTREQRCWFHVQANVLAALPKSAHPAEL